jgi:hypothetical protein
LISWSDDGQVRSLVIAGKLRLGMDESGSVSWKSRVLGKGFSFTGVYTILPNRNGFSPNGSLY